MIVQIMGTISSFFYFIIIKYNYILLLFLNILHWYTPLKISNRTAVETSTKLPVTDLKQAHLRCADSNLHRYKYNHYFESSVFQVVSHVEQI